MVRTITPIALILFAISVQPPISGGPIRTVPLASTPQTALPSSYRLADIEIEMERLGCLGECPVYRLEVKGDGSGSYEGTNYVKTKGRRVFRISQDTVVRLLQGFYDIGFFGFTQDTLHSTVQVSADRGGQVLVQPGGALTLDDEEVWIRIRIGSYQKHASSNRSSLVGSGLWALSRRIDMATPALQWSGTK